MSNSDWIFQLLGRFHPLILHFPIGLLVIAFLFEILTIGGKRKGLREGINWMVYFGGGFAAFSAFSGWLLRTFDDYSGELVDYHQYSGIATALFASTTAFLLYQTIKGKLGSYLIYRSFFLMTVLLLAVAGHLGAGLTHGEDYLTSVFDQRNNAVDDEQSGILLAELKKSNDLSETQQIKLNMHVRAIFVHNCYQCHSENKQKGGLILDSKKGVFAGGDSGKAIVVGDAEASELYKRIILKPGQEGVMPNKGKVLKPQEIGFIKLWINSGAYWSDEALKVFPEAPLALAKPELPKVEDQLNPVDKIIDNYFEKQNISWPEVIDDRLFIKRAYADIIGLLPEPTMVQAFVKSSEPNKRAELIDSLLNDNHNYTQHWLSFWNDLLRNDYSGPGFITRDRTQITDWLYQSLLANNSYDQMVKELVNPNDRSQGFIKGVQWRGEVNASQRTEMQAAQNIGQALMGVNLKCASCHNSFVSNLTLEQAYGFASVFADSTLEMNRCDKPIGKYAKIEFIYPELGSVEAASLKERLKKLSEIMVQPKNGRLYRTITNRIWYQLMGRGIVEPLDEMDNTPWSADLLDWLAADFIDSGTDLKQLIRQIMTSKAYQLPNTQYEKQEDLKTKYVFAGPVMRRLSAEQFADAVSQVIAPMFYAVEYDPNEEQIPAKRIWSRQVSFGRTVLPEPGERYFRKTFKLSSESIKDAKALISVDHSYVLYVNDKEVSKGNDWQIVDQIDLTQFLKPGTNLIAISGENEGPEANPAGVLFAMKVQYENGKEFQLYSNEDWSCLDMKPTDGWTSLDFDDSSWLKAFDYGRGNFKDWGNLIAFSFIEKDVPFARASMVKQHPFLKVLGRPSRENVTTSRESQATLLQALELTNGDFFDQVLADGAMSWIQEYDGASDQIIDALYQKTLFRNPSKREKKLLLSALGDNPETEQVQDVFWAVLISPEFQFIN